MFSAHKQFIGKLNNQLKKNRQHPLDNQKPNH